MPISNRLWKNLEASSATFEFPLMTSCISKCVYAVSYLSLLSSTLDEVYAWLTPNRLSVNPSKTEFLIFGNPQQRNKIQSSSIVFCGNVISPSASARHLGVTFDSSLSLTKHISSICKPAYYQIRQLCQIRSSLDISSAIILANSLVISKLDYCNSLLNGLPKSSINPSESPCSNNISIS